MQTRVLPGASFLASACLSLSLSVSEIAALRSASPGWDAQPSTPVEEEEAGSDGRRRALEKLGSSRPSLERGLRAPGCLPCLALIAPGCVAGRCAVLGRPGKGGAPSMKEPRAGSAGAMEGLGSGVSALEKSVADLTVMDVYDIASLVGQEFERLIDQHGCEAIGRLMPKVVRVLEILEVLVSRDHISPEVEELRLELDRLRLERVDRLEKERKHQKELELVEDVWRGEAQDLLTQIAQLQEENKQLMTNLANKDGCQKERGK
ncbi:hypothetical protein E2320_012499 [Naja naja]|nr:hypothetical protein E2320_012499 [Naja naja]